MYSAGRKVPALDNQPSIIGYEWLWRAYKKLTTCRQNGLSTGSIPWTAVQKYAEVAGLGSERSHVLHEVIEGLDSAMQAERAKEEEAKNKPPPPGAPRKPIPRRASRGAVRR